MFHFLPVGSPARAAYSDADVFILDDPFSAVDATVGETLFHACLRGMLRLKTVLLVTNQVQHRTHGLMWFF